MFQQRAIQNLPTRKVKLSDRRNTIELANGQIVRFVGVNAPNNGEPYEEERQEANAKLIQGKTVTLEYDTYASDHASAESWRIHLLMERMWLWSL